MREMEAGAENALLLKRLFTSLPPVQQASAIEALDAADERARVVKALEAALAYLAMPIAPVADECEPVRVQREGAVQEMFAGTWPPTDPRSLAIQWAALLDEMDELPPEALDEDGGLEGTEIFERWQELDKAIHRLDPKTPEGAAAILYAAGRDEERGAGTEDWDNEVLETARLHAPRSQH